MIYLDHSATSPILPEAKRAMLEVLDHFPGNPSALHEPGQRAKNIIESARAQVAQLINATPEEIIFTASGSESNNTVIRTFTNQPIAVSAIEHPSVLEPAKTFAKPLTILPVDQNGQVQISPDFFKSPPKLLSIMLANNELGTIQPITKISKIVSALESSDHPCFLHTDATQALGKIKIDVKRLKVDYLTASAHKIGGPTGVGLLYVKKGSPYQPLVLGGHQENGRRAGTYNTAAIAGFGAAAEFVLKNQTWQTYDTKIRPLRDQLAQLILKNIPGSQLNTKITPQNFSLPHILNISFSAAEGESIQLYLDAINKIIVSTGSACASGNGIPSHVIMATKHDAETAHSSIRFSLGLNATAKDIQATIKALKPIIFRLQNISTISVKDTK